GSITEGGAGSIAVANLAALGGAGVTLDSGITIGTLAGQSTTNSFIVVNSGSMTVGTVDGVSGIATSGQPVSLTADGAGSLLTVSQSISAGNADVTLIADDMS